MNLRPKQLSKLAGKSKQSGLLLAKDAEDAPRFREERTEAEDEGETAQHSVADTAADAWRIRHLAGDVDAEKDNARQLQQREEQRVGSNLREYEHKIALGLFTAK